MKTIIYIFSIALITLTGCEFINTKILGKPSKAEIEQMRLDSIRIADSLKIADSIAKAKFEEEEAVRIADSIAQAEIEAKKAEKARNKFHVISGSFKTPKFADQYKDRMINHYGYEDTRILQNEYGFKLVAIQSFPDKNEALQGLRQIRNEGKFQVWLHTSN